MHGDFSRLTFDKTKKYTHVLKQQGRVDLDADWNEYTAIQSYLDRTRVGDIIGPSGAPLSGGGFLISLASDLSDLDIGAGHFYLDGILCEADDTTYADQPDYPAAGPLSPPALSGGAPAAPLTVLRRDLVYLDVWERHITALVDAHIREVALGGPDTATRVRTVWQVKVLEDVEAEECGDDIAGWPPAATGQGRLTNSLETAPSAEEDPCVITPESGYRGLENRFYRVEIHTHGNLGTATFVWSRDNGSVVFKLQEIDAVDGTKITVGSLGKDSVLGLHPTDWIEVISEETELNGTPGTLARIEEVVNEAEGKLRLSVDVSGHAGETNLRVRRWDDANGARLATNSLTDLEDGIQVQFSGSDMRSGDYWTFAARTVNIDPVELLTDALPQGIEHHYARLALITWWRRTARSLVEVAAGDIRPDVALTWETSPDGLTWTFHLDATATHADGSPFTATDAKAAIDAASGSIDGFASSAATDDTTLVITLGAPNAALLQQAAGSTLIDGLDEVIGRVEDCRPTFPALTELTNLYYVGGDGQEAMPGETLLQPLIVRVTNGEHGVAGAAVEFSTADGGTLHSAAGSGASLVVPTDAEGYAQCTWTLDPDQQSQTATARLVDLPHLRVVFAANLSRASHVHYTPDPACGPLSAVTTVKEALDELCQLIPQDDPGIHVERVLWIDGDLPAVNDREVKRSVFLGGLRVVVDQAVTPESVRRPTCYVTLDLPFPVNHPVWGNGVAGYETITLDSKLSVAGPEIVWEPSAAAQSWLNTKVGPFLEEGARLLVRLTLKGNFIWAEGDSSLNLDGEVFGTPDGAAPHNVELPSGNRRRGGDLEMWFWLAADELAAGGLDWSIEGVSGVAWLDPIRANDAQDVLVIDLLYGGLVRLNEKHEVVPDLAADWSVGAGGLQYTFLLRAGQTFSNGDPLTANDVAFSLDRARNGPDGWSGPIYLDGIDGIEVIDDVTLRIHLLKPSRYFLQQLTTAPAKIVSQAAVETGDNWDVENLVTSGAYTVEGGWNRSDRMLPLIAHPGYWQLASVRQIRLHFFQDTAQPIAAFQAGQMDIVGSLQNGLPTGTPGMRETDDPSCGRRYVGFNHQAEGLADARVRMALALSVNRDTLAGTLDLPFQDFEPRILPPCIDEGPLDVNLAFDCAKAQELLAEAGFSGPLQLVWTPEANNEAVVQALAEMWRECLDLNVELRKIDDLRDYSALLHKLATAPADSDVQMYYSVWRADYADPQNALSQQLHTVGGPADMNNDGHYSNDQFDNIVGGADAASTVDRAVYRRAELIALQEVAWIPLFAPRTRVLLRQGVGGLAITGRGIMIPDFSALSAPV